MIRLAYHPNSYLRHDIDVDEALAHIATVGWDGFEWSSSTLQEHFGSAEACRDRLDDLGIALSGMYHPCRFESAEEIEDWVDRAEKAVDFCLTVGTEVLMLDGGSTDLPVTSESIGHVAEAADRVARITCDAGMICTWHQHWNTLFQYPDEFHALMDATDPDRLKCTLDTAQLALGGFDIPTTFRRYCDRMCYVHLKDLAPDRRFADLGHGTVDMLEPASILAGSDFTGWIVNDLDYTDNDPYETSRLSLEFLRDLLEIDHVEQ